MFLRDARGYTTAISSCGKAKCWQEALALFLVAGSQGLKGRESLLGNAKGDFTAKCLQLLGFQELKESLRGCEP